MTFYTSACTNGYFFTSSLSISIMLNILLAAPDGWLIPASHASTVFFVTPRYPAKELCDIPTEFLIFLICSAWYSFTGIIVTVRLLNFLFVDCASSTASFNHHGKRGGVRVCYVDFVIKETIYLITVYSKNQKDNLSEEEKKEIKKLIDILEKSV